MPDHKKLSEFLTPEGATKNSWSLKMGPIGCPEMSGRNYHHSLRNSPEERRPRVLRDGNLKSREVTKFVHLLWTVLSIQFNVSVKEPLT